MKKQPSEKSFAIQQYLVAEEAWIWASRSTYDTLDEAIGYLLAYLCSLEERGAEIHHENFRVVTIKLRALDVFKGSTW